MECIYIEKKQNQTSKHAKNNKIYLNVRVKGVHREHLSKFSFL